MEIAVLLTLLKNGTIRVFTDRGEITLPINAEDFRDDQIYMENSWGKFKIRVYQKGGATTYRDMKLTCKEDLTVERIEFVIDFGQTPETFIEYKSFINAPAAAFVRFGERGFYTGVENPFFSVTQEEGKVTVSYEPSLILKKGEIYETEPQFLGSYELSGEYVVETEPINIEAMQKQIKRGRFFNPCGEIPLDKAEIDAMIRYVTEYYDVIKKNFDNILYFFFYPKKQLPETREEVADYLFTIDRFSKIRGDVIAFNPHIKTTIPTEEKPYWELAPEGTAAEEILHYAQRKGMRCGYYMGCAFNGDGGNAALLPFMPEKTAWKKVDAFGNRAKENCLGCDEYLDWWYEVQKNTIEKYDLGYWAWDPGPGNGNDCYATDHGHIPGKGAYKGWRNSQKLLKSLKERFPELFLMSFYGRKEYGIWGFRYFSQHEVYWEQTVLFGATLHSDLHDDRVNAHGTRLQNQWSMNFRFLPAHLGHGLVPRMGESWFDPAMEQAYGHGGWKFALLSAIACCGSVTHCTLPDKLENVPGLQEFYEKWIRWAKEKYRFCEFTRPITDRVSNEVIDGFSRIDKDCGQIFLFNSSPKILRKKLLLDRKLGLDTKKGFYLKLLYFEGMKTEEEGMQYQGSFRMGDLLDITLPPYGAVVLELSDTESKSLEVLPYKGHTIDQFWDTEGNEFVYPVHPAFDEITLCAEAVLKSELKEALEKRKPENEAFLKEKIEKWHSDGMPFTFTSAQPNRLLLYLPFEGVKMPQNVQLFINEKEVPVEVFGLHKTPIAHFAFAEEYIQWDQTNQIRLRIQGLNENSFMGIYVGYPEGIDGMEAKEKVFEERQTAAGLYADDSLVIESFTMTPEVLSDENERFTVSVKTNVSPEQIEGVYFLHPTQPQMPGLTYDNSTGCWTGTYESGRRSHNIFCNSVITAWIKGKNGGVGPKVEKKIQIRYQK